MQPLSGGWVAQEMRPTHRGAVVVDAIESVSVTLGSPPYATHEALLLRSTAFPIASRDRWH
jgi:hypothetical protein